MSSRVTVVLVYHPLNKFMFIKKVGLGLVSSATI